MISRPYFPWFSLAKAGKPWKNNEKKPLLIPRNRFLEKIPNPFLNDLVIFLNRSGRGWEEINILLWGLRKLWYNDNYIQSEFVEAVYHDRKRENGTGNAL